MRKELVIGVSNFREIRELHNYYVDKSLLISELPYKSSQVILITRPRRFGKTLNMDMVAEFFDITKDSKDIFRYLKIMDTSHATEINSRPVIYLTFKDCKVSRSEVILNLKRQLSRVYSKYSNAVSCCSNRLQSAYKQIESVINARDSLNAPPSDSLEVLCEVLYEFYKVKPILLLDEYDTPLNTAYSIKDSEILSYFSLMYGTTFKDNSYVGMCLLTGIQRVAKENIFSGLNNIVVHTVNNIKYREYFGFTEEETRELLNYYDLELTDEVKNMYDGYNFGGSLVYNPWSVLNYAYNKELMPY